ncbi:hypothetical protein LUZ60_009749 [Juncus effusus]|nr:hypothetical protein LUZ60_009749 [Juncus effusus]
MERGGYAKVTVVVTKFVEADAEQFKSVVQTLTGKDSAWLKGSDREKTCGQMMRRPLEGRNVKQDGGLGLMPSMDELVEFLRD